MVPFSPFGDWTVQRLLAPFLLDFLYALSESDGADQTRIGVNSSDADRNGEPEGELGLVIHGDTAWKAQLGAPIDTQAGNKPGGGKDIRGDGLPGFGFNTGGGGGKGNK